MLRWLQAFIPKGLSLGTRGGWFEGIIHAPFPWKWVYNDGSHYMGPMRAISNSDILKLCETDISSNRIEIDYHRLWPRTTNLEQVVPCDVCQEVPKAEKWTPSHNRLDTEQRNARVLCVIKSSATLQSGGISPSTVRTYILQGRFFCRSDASNAATIVAA